MDLATFDAILTFAMDFEERAAEFYTAASQGVLEEVFKNLEKGSIKRMKRMERTRREGVAEMILEPISGLNGDDYNITLDPDSDMTSLLEQAISLETSASRFYQDAAEKLPIREVVRTFTRMAAESEVRKNQLENVNPKT